MNSAEAPVAASDGLLSRPTNAHCLFVMAHGAGAGMRHPFMEEMAQRLSDEFVATYRYEFPYMEERKRRPDSPRLLQERVCEAVDAAHHKARDLSLVAGGKSLGGRMTSHAAANGDLPLVRGLVFLGFPLHAPGRPGTARADHLDDVSVPMLFVQGTRDALADLDLIRDVCRRLGDRATLHIVEDGDHSFKVRKSSGQDPSRVTTEIARAVAAWTSGVL